MDRTAPDGRARLLAVLAVLLGLLAMHGLASGHHAAAVTPVTGTAAGTSAASVEAGQHSQHQAEGASVHSAMQHAAAAAAPAAGLLVAVLPGADYLADACTDCTGHGAAALCLAVLSVGLALLARLLARRTQAGGLPAPQLRLPVLRAGPPLRIRPPDLVSQLCVSRT